MAKDYLELAKKIDASIKAGNLRSAQDELRRQPPARIPSHLKTEFAALARRSNLPLLGIRILGPVVRGKKIASGKSLEKAKAEYACSLTRIGASKEALSLLRTVNEVECSEKLLFEALALFTQWRYAEAAPLLEKYLSHSDLTPYQKLVGNMNLAIAFVDLGENQKAERLLLELRKGTQDPSLRLLHGNVLQYLAQVSIDSSQWDIAEKHLKEAELLLHKDTGTDALFVRKWRSFLEIRRFGPTKKGLEELSNVRKMANELGHWETLRSCDFEEAIQKNDLRLFAHVYTGTPYENLREKMKSKLSVPFEVPSRYLWNLSEGEKNQELDLLDEGHSPYELKAGTLLHRLLYVLGTDFYRPFRTAMLYGELFPGEYFNPDSSPSRVYQGIFRFKSWLKRNKIPLTIEEKNDTYRLKGTQPVSLAVYSGTQILDRSALLLSRLRESFSEPFSVEQAAKLWKVSPRSALSLLQEAIKSKRVERIRFGVKIRYRFVVELRLAA